MRNWAKWYEGKTRRSEAARKAAAARWDAHHAAHAGDPQRHSRVTDITIRDSHRPMQTVRIHRESIGHAWSRGRIYVNGQRVGHRAYGRTALAKLIAEALS
jgi:hypothetical protein